MKTKSFTQTKSYFWLHCFLIASLLVFGMILSTDAAPKKYKGHAKVEREFSKRKYQNLAEQERQQYQGIKTYNPRNKWQKRTKHGRK